MDFSCASHKFLDASRHFPKGTWLHVDVADAKFTYNKSWGNPEELKKLLISHPKFNFNIEVHLMVEEPEEVVKQWVDAPIKRVIVHLEAILDQRYRKKKMEGTHVIESIIKRCASRGIEVMLSSNPETKLEDFKEYLDYFSQFQVLAVKPGLAGQKFLPVALQKIKFLRQEFPNATIEVDGGIGLETGRLAKEAGADVLVAASYIFDNSDPKRAYEELLEI
ncbi:MAG: hypothetical protein HY093_00880 [Candidatus Liptonbacteria bacterium]|nr:hypothetical protein [Candidatus Liptonbacteria bacterium]